MKKRYKILSIILALVIAIGSIVTISIFSSSAESFTDENGISWTVTENKPGWAIKPTNRATISGHVVIPSEYNGEPINMIDNQAFSGCKNLTSVDIPDSVTYISSYSFESCTGLTNIEIPDSVTTIGSAFYNCTSLSSVNLGNSVQTLEGTFKKCTSLTSITIPDSVTTIGASTFENCTNLTNVDIPDSITTIGVSTFKNCTNLTNVDIPDSVTTIGAYAFNNCSSLSSVNIPSGVTIIEKYAFYNCTSLTSITIPDSVTTIGASAFENCTSLTNIYLGNSIKTFGGSVFNSTAWYNTQADGILYIGRYCIGYKGTKPSGELVIADGTVAIADYAFDSCTGITSVKIPDSLITIGAYAFYGCTGIKNVNIPSNVTSIEEYAFYKCTSLTSITIPDSVISIGSNAFAYCSKLSEVFLPSSFTGYEQSLKSIFGNTAWYNNLEDGLIYYDNVLIGYKGTKPSGELVIADGTIAIGSYAFRNCTGLTSIEIPDSVTTIGAYAFEKCTNLTSIEIPSGVTTIGASAFAQCTGIASVDISDSVTTIGAYAFVNCTSLTSVEIPVRITTINYGTFSGCTGLTSINIPNSVTAIEEHAFYDCKNIVNAILGDSLQSIGSMAFYNCTNLTSIEIPDSVTTIGASAFEKCTSVENIILPSSLTSVEYGAFSNCGLIETLTINCSFDVLATDTFYNDTFLNVVLDENITSIGDEFSNMEELENIVIPNTVTNIKDTAFVGSPNVTITTTSNSTAHKFANANNIPVNIIDAVNTVDPVSFEVTCDKSGYEFTVYKVADLETTTNPYEVRYNSSITDIEDEIFEGDSEALLAELDKVDSSLLTEVVGTYSTDEDGASKLFENLEPGIYYVRATDFPANVYGVQNSVFALPYYDAVDGWIYEIDPIPLATKVDESNPEIVKTITNSTKDNTNFTDVSLGDTVNFEIEASRVGSANEVESKDFKLNSYVVSDIMESGLTLNQDSFVVTLEDIDGNTIATLEDTTDYLVNIVANEGVDTTFTVSLTPEYLQENEFYSSANVVIAYSAVLNEYSTREFDGNYNTATNLTYSNKTDVSATVDGNTVYAYTFGIEVNKYDDAGTPLAGSEFGLYLTEDDAKAMQNAIATGTSTTDGKVEFYTEDEDVIRLASGTYYIVETKATENYNRYTDVIPVTITVEYGDTEVNGTYIESAPENGIQLVEVKNSKVVIPNTGGDGALYRYIIAAAFAMLALTFIVLKKRNSKKAVEN